MQVSDDVVCVFNATPLEKYESYRLFLDQWSRCDDGPDFAPTIYNLIDSLAKFLEINRYSPHNGTQPKFLVDMLPEVYGGASDALLQRLLSRKGISEQDRESMLATVEQRGSAYLSAVNAFYIREFQMIQASEDATRFLHHACRGLPNRLNGSLAAEIPDNDRVHILDRLYARVVEEVVALFGSRVLHPSRPAPEFTSNSQLSRAALEKALLAAVDIDPDEAGSVRAAMGISHWAANLRCVPGGKSGADQHSQVVPHPPGRAGGRAKSLRHCDCKTPLDRASVVAIRTRLIRNHSRSATLDSLPSECRGR